MIHILINFINKIDSDKLVTFTNGTNRFFVPYAGFTLSELQLAYEKANSSYPTVNFKIICEHFMGDESDTVILSTNETKRYRWSSCSDISFVLKLAVLLMPAEISQGFVL